MTGRPLIGIPLALMIECEHWTKLRWDFTPEATGRAWQITVLMIVFSSVFIFLDTNAYVALPSILSWMPVLLLPMQFVQSFGLHESLPLNTFSFLARHRRQRNLRFGLTEALIHIHFGNVYFVAAMVASTLGSQANWWPFLPGIIILTGWLLLSVSRSRPISLLISLIIAGGIAVGGQIGINKLQDFLQFGAYQRDSGLPNSKTTMIGQPGPIIQSADIVWRLRLEGKSPPPKLLKTASYNDYHIGTWKTMVPGGVEFKDLDTRLHQQVPYYLLAGNLTEADQFKAVSDSLSRFKLRGSATKETPMPLTGDAASLRDFEVDGIERNELGSARVFPTHSVIDGSVLWGGENDPESAPFSKEDLAIPFSEKETLKAVIETLKLDQQPSLEEKLGVLHRWFQKEFSYTRNPTIRASSYVAKKPTAMTQFLTTTRAGHCEYFASAAALLLRQAGIPTRYTIGYSVLERDAKRQEYVIRGTHGHAWCRVWDTKSSRWIDFDTTPSGWGDMVSMQNSWIQSLNDTVQRLREDFFLWRSQPSNRLAVTLVMSFIGLCLISFIASKLWRSKRRVVTSKKSNIFEGTVVQTPLNALEPQVAKHLGSRPVGQPLAAWLKRLKSAQLDASLLDEAIEIHQRLRFDPATPAPADQDRLQKITQQIESIIRQKSI